MSCSSVGGCWTPHFTQGNGAGCHAQPHTRVTRLASDCREPVIVPLRHLRRHRHPPRHRHLLHRRRPLRRPRLPRYRRRSLRRRSRRPKVQLRRRRRLCRRRSHRSKVRQPNRHPPCLQRRPDWTCPIAWRCSVLLCPCPFSRSFARCSRSRMRARTPTPIGLPSSYECLSRWLHTHAFRVKSHPAV